MTVSPATAAPAGPTAPEEQRVTWAELFFDLVWVFVITQIAGVLAHAHSAEGALKALVLFVPLWMGWVGAALLGNAAGPHLDGAHGRLLIFALAACGLGMSVAVPRAFGDDGVVFGSCYVLMRLILWQRMRRWPTFGGLRVEPFAVSLLVNGPLVLIGGLAAEETRLTLWGLAAVVEILGTAILGRRLDQVRFETSHLPERFGLFVILALGETVVAAGANASQAGADTPTLLTLGLAFSLILLLWWTYFHYGAPAARHSLSSDPVQARVVRDVFSYAHLVYAIGIICMAVSLKVLLRAPLQVPHELAGLLAAPGAALYLGGFCYARRRMFGAVAVPRFTGAVLCVALSLLAPHVPLLVTVGAVVLVLGAVNGVEAWIVETGRPLPLVRLPKPLRSRAGD
ncbi:low temperature requirement protein A [Streptomyces sp. NPDC047022]|uniref:low temperature requirement protein A n=1 Tax=Streptomyces sp. NPDC047022 TaxID=3155737 RepID=UPI0033F64EFD